MTSPASRSLALLRAEGWTCAIVERWNQYARVRQDLFGFIDILAVSPSKGILAVQTTSTTNFSHRLEKIGQEPKAGICLAAGMKIEVHGWAKQGPRGKRKVWTCRRERWVPDRQYLPSEPILKPLQESALTHIAGQKELLI